MVGKALRSLDQEVKKLLKTGAITKIKQINSNDENPPYYINLKVNNTNVNFEIDTGTANTIIPYEIF